MAKGMRTYASCPRSYRPDSMREPAHEQDSAAPAPPVLSNDDVPFEAPRRLARVRNAARRINRQRERLPAGAFSAAILVYALGAAVAGYFGSGLLLFAWLMAGPLGITVYLTFDGHGSLLNPYTLFFSAVVLLSVGAHVVLN